MKYIKKKSVVSLPPINGSISDTTNITDKTTNAYSARLIEEMFNGLFEEGTWTPTLNTLEGKKPTVTYSKQLGSYAKFGKLVYVTCFIEGVITALNGTNNYPIVEGLPYSPKYNTNGFNPGTIGKIYNLTDNETNLVVCTVANGVRINKNYGGGTPKLILSNTVSNYQYFEIAFSCWYICE